VIVDDGFAVLVCQMLLESLSGYLQVDRPAYRGPWCTLRKSVDSHWQRPTYDAFPPCVSEDVKNSPGHCWCLHC